MILVFHNLFCFTFKSTIIYFFQIASFQCDLHQMLSSVIFFSSLGTALPNGEHVPQPLFRNIILFSLVHFFCAHICGSFEHWVASSNWQTLESFYVTKNCLCGCVAISHPTVRKWFGEVILWTVTYVRALWVTCGSLHTSEYEGENERYGK